MDGGQGQRARKVAGDLAGDLAEDLAAGLAADLADLAEELAADLAEDLEEESAPQLARTQHKISAQDPRIGSPHRNRADALGDSRALRKAPVDREGHVLEALSEALLWLEEDSQRHLLSVC